MIRDENVVLSSIHLSTKEEWDKQIINSLYWCVHKWEWISCNACWHCVNNSKYYVDICLNLFIERIGEKDGEEKITDRTKQM